MLSSLALLNFPAAQAAHTRSVLVLPAVSTPLPAAQFVMAVQSSVPVVLDVPVLKKSLGHATHVRSLLSVGATVVLKPAPQAAVVAPQAFPSLAALKVSPTVHAAHWRFAEVLPATDCPWATAQVCQVAQALAAVWPVPALNLPEPHAVQSVSSLWLSTSAPASVLYRPTVHTLQLAWPACSWYFPAAQMSQSVPGPSWAVLVPCGKKRPATQASQLDCPASGW